MIDKSKYVDSNINGAPMPIKLRNFMFHTKDIEKYLSFFVDAA